MFCPACVFVLRFVLLLLRDISHVLRMYAFLRIPILFAPNGGWLGKALEDFGRLGKTLEDLGRLGKTLEDLGKRVHDGRADKHI